jgi:hypothetical protein
VLARFEDKIIVTDLGTATPEQTAASIEQASELLAHFLTEKLEPSDIRIEIKFTIFKG